MEITVQFTTQLRAALGASQQTVSLPAGASVRDLLDTLTQQHPESFQRLVVDANGNLRPNLFVCVDDQQIQQLDVILRPHQTVTLLSAISGG